jgi:predicted dehydrogenase
MTIPVAVIGAGSIAEFHLKAYRANPDVELRWVCDIDAARAEERARQFGAVGWTTSLADVLADPEVRAVSICTRNDAHADVAVAALESGKSVLVEKPMARSAAEAQRLVAAEAASPGIVQVGYVRRWSPNARVLKSFIDNQRLGEIYYAVASCVRRAGNPGGWFAEREISGGGPLIDLGVHFLDLAWYLMGAPRAVAVSGYTFERLGNRANITNLSRWKSADYDPDRNSVEDLAGALVRFEGGAMMFVELSYSLHGREGVAVRLHGERGGAELEPALRITTEDLDTILDVTPVIDSLGFEMDAAFQAEIDGFVTAVRDGTPSIAPATHGLELARIIDAIYSSAAIGAEVRLDA